MGGWNGGREEGGGGILGEVGWVFIDGESWVGVFSCVLSGEKFLWRSLVLLLLYDDGCDVGVVVRLDDCTPTFILR